MNMNPEDLRALVNRAIKRGWIRLRDQPKPASAILASVDEAWKRIERLRQHPLKRDVMLPIDKDVLIPHGWAVGRDDIIEGMWHVELTEAGAALTRHELETELLKSSI